MSFSLGRAQQKHGSGSVMSPLVSLLHSRHHWSVVPQQRHSQRRKNSASAIHRDVPKSLRKGHRSLPFVASSALVARSKRTFTNSSGDPTSSSSSSPSSSETASSATDEADSANETNEFVLGITGDQSSGSGTGNSEGSTSEETGSEIDSTAVSSESISDIRDSFDRRRYRDSRTALTTTNGDTSGGGSSLITLQSFLEAIAQSASGSSSTTMTKGSSETKSERRVEFEIVSLESLRRSSIAEGVSSVFHFSFMDYFDDKRQHFGKLRVINDDVLAPDTGADWHPHMNMDIVTYVVSGQVRHEDDLHSRMLRSNPYCIAEPNNQVLSRGDAQLMVCTNEYTEEDGSHSEKRRRPPIEEGSIRHREWNASDSDHRCRMIQVWLHSKNYDSDHPSIYQVCRRADCDSEEQSRMNQLRHILTGSLDRSRLEHSGLLMGSSPSSNNDRVFEDLPRLQATSDGVDIYVCELLSHPECPSLDEDCDNDDPSLLEMDEKRANAWQIGMTQRVPFELNEDKQAYIMCLEGNINIECRNDEMEGLIESVRQVNFGDNNHHHSEYTSIFKDGDLSSLSMSTKFSSSRDKVMAMLNESLKRSSVEKKPKRDKKGSLDGPGSKVSDMDPNDSDEDETDEEEDDSADELESYHMLGESPELIWVDTDDITSTIERELGAEASAQQILVGARHSNVDFVFDGCSATDSIVLREGEAVKIWGSASLQFSPFLDASKKEHRLDGVSAQLMVVSVPKDVMTPPPSGSQSFLSSIKFW